MSSRILVVDDDPVFVHIAVRRLETFGYEVSSLSDPELLFVTLSQQPYDLIIMDIEMPHVDGITLLKHLKENPNVGSIPVIMVTASPDDDVLAECLDLGAVDFLRKPFAKTAVRARVRSALAVGQVSNQQVTHREEIEAHVKRLEKECADRRHMQDHLARVNTALEQFVHVVSQDLRAPIQAISENVRSMEQAPADERDPLIKAVRDQVDQVEVMISELLEYAQTKWKPHVLESVDCEEVIQQTLANLESQIQSSDAAIERDPLPCVLGEHDQLVILFQNIISNAIKFSNGDRPLVDIRVKWNDNHWAFSVIDHGVGMSEDRVASITKMFQATGRADEYANTGIGLAICKNVVDQHGGVIGVDSEQGKGSTFHFTLPSVTNETNPS